MTQRKEWFYCPHWERFLIRGSQDCLLCEPPRQMQTPQPVQALQPGRRSSLRAIFPILDDHGDALSDDRRPLVS
ncbi:MAG TPA: hypothetical protein VH599_02620 [Ktedonobacterales bacterium]|jgi:hypothetical protein